MKEASDRILRAIKDKERMVLYGDADLDGVSSVVILKETIENIGGRVNAVYFPDREKEGYGINRAALNLLKKEAPALFITLDCGISNFDEIELAKELGFEVMVIDHHQPLERLPAAALIIDPKQEGDEYPFKELACTGIVYQLSKCLFSESQGLNNSWRPEDFLDLVAMATLADQMVLIEDNEKLVAEGTLALRYPKREGMKALIAETDLGGSTNIFDVRQKILPPLNAAGHKEHLNEAYLLLTEDDFQRACSLARVLIERAALKREEKNRVYDEAEALLNLEEAIIFDGSPSWTLVLLGPVASRLCQKYKKPVFIFRKGEDTSQGAVRMPEGQNAVEAMTSCRDFLETYGGHPPAAGFKIKNENLNQFKTCLIKYFNERTPKI